VRANEADFPVARLCRLLGVSRSGYYAWRERAPSRRSQKDAELIKEIRGFHARSDRTYGAPRIQLDLAAKGEHVGQKRVARLMRAEGLVGVTRRKWMRTTIQDDSPRFAPDLVKREFSAEKPNELWVADITYIPTWAGFLYLAVVLDVWSRRIVGWSMRSHMPADLVVEALDMALSQRQARGVTHHSDRGTQYTSIAFTQRCEQAGVVSSMGSTGDCYDNALAESFFATLECELISRRSWRTHSEARLAIFEFIEGWYNSRRRHSSIGGISPMAFEALQELEHAA